ncbi:MAG: RsmE family RNA methyltransferase, partial [Actinomycetota bacterium]|nr:RsmE family RNA methyltransferase [Actinomycetota bacterium]
MGRHIPHVYLPEAWDRERLHLDDKTRDHLEKVLRLGGATPVTYTDGVGAIGEGKYEAGFVERGDEEAAVGRSHEVAIAVAPPKNLNRIRFIVEKLAELGVARLLWLQTEYTEGRPPRADKVRAWARASLEQSRGTWLMEVGPSVTMADVAEYGRVLVADRSGSDIEAAGHFRGAVLCVGPEGG